MNKTIDISGITLHAGRLVLRPWKESDLEDFFEYASVDGVGQMAGWLPHKSIEDSCKILSKLSPGRRTLRLNIREK